MLDNHHNNIKNNSISSLFWMTISSGGQQGFSFVVFMILTRMLDVAEFGLMALATVLVDVMILVSRCGLTEAIIQKTNLSENEKSTAFWASLILGFFSSVIIYLGAPALSDIFKQDSLLSVFELLATLPLLNALGTVHEGILRKEFGYKSLAIRNLVSNFISGLFAVILAFNGFGILSLIAQRIISILLMTGMMWVNLKWLPNIYFSKKICKEQLRFGMPVAMSNLLASGNQKIVDLVVGYVLGPLALGYLRISWRGLDLLLELILRPITNITLSTFSALSGDRQAIAAAYIRISQLTFFASLPVFIGAGLVAPEFIRLTFGSQWEHSILPMQILTLTILTFPIIYFKNNALLAVGKSKEVLKLNVLEFMLSFGVVAFCAHFGLVAAAIGNVLRVVLITPLIVRSLHRHISLNSGLLLKKCLPFVYAVSFMSLAVMIERILLPINIDITLKIILLILTGAIAYFSFLMMTYRSILLEIIGIFLIDNNKLKKIERLFKVHKR